MNVFGNNYNEKENVTALVVTYNRKELLKECLDAILSQTYSVDRLIIIDNASTDGTKQMLEDTGYIDNPIIAYYGMVKNLGGSGGFYEGIIHAMEDKKGWIWLMDDDTIPQKDCLEKLIEANNVIQKQLSRQISFLASTIYGQNGEFMNVPSINNSPSENGYPSWYKFLNRGIISIKSATFVSLLINKVAVMYCGYPCRDYFIWGDDTEYTTRLSTYYGDAFFVGNSIAIHKRKGAKNLSIDNERDPQRIKMYYYYYRNRMVNRHFYNENYRGTVLEMIKALLQAMKYINYKPYGLEMAKVIIKGSWAGITQFNSFKDYINGELVYYKDNL